MADTTNITAANTPNTANILARNRREVDTRSAEADQNSAAANRENPATREVEAGVAVIGAVIGVLIDSPVTDPSSSVDLVIRTTGVGTPLGAGAFLTRLTTAIILTGIILRIGTIMVMTVAPYQESDSLGPDYEAASLLCSALSWSRARAWASEFRSLPPQIPVESL
jgi:hypothetical protein